MDRLTVNQLDDNCLDIVYSAPVKTKEKPMSTTGSINGAPSYAGSWRLGRMPGGEDVLSRIGTEALRRTSSPPPELPLTGKSAQDLFCEADGYAESAPSHALRLWEAAARLDGKEGYIRLMARAHKYRSGLCNAKKNPALALDLYKLANGISDSAIPAYICGHMYAEGEGDSSNEREARRWWTIAAKKNIDQTWQWGRVEKASPLATPLSPLHWITLLSVLVDEDYAPAMNAFGNAFKRGTCLERDDLKAVEWYRKAADKGLGDAMGNIGQCYRFGRGVPQSEPDAIEWYQKAGAAKCPQAFVILAEIHRDKKTPEGDRQAIQYYLAGGDDPTCLYGLGWMYEAGRGVEKDKVRAKKLYNQAEKLGYKPKAPRVQESHAAAAAAGPALDPALNEGRF